MGHATEAEAHLKDALIRAEAAATLANTYAQQIDDAKRDASAAKALLTDARQLATEAKKLAGEATAGVYQLKAPRALNNVPELIFRLKAFPNTQYRFSGMFADEESFQILKQMDDALRQSGWLRVASQTTFPALDIFGNGDGANQITGIGIRVSVESPASLEKLRALSREKTPSPVKEAATLCEGLRASLFPTDENVATLGLSTGTSKVIAISIGRKP